MYIIRDETFHFESSKHKISLVKVQGGQEGLSEIQEKDQVKKVDENWHNFLVRYMNYKLLSSLERLLKGIHDSTFKLGK